MGHEVKSSRAALQVKSLMSRGLRTVVAKVKWGDCYGYGGADHQQGRRYAGHCTNCNPWDKRTTGVIMIHPENTNITTQLPVVRKQQLIVQPVCTHPTCGGETIALKIHPDCTPVMKQPQHFMIQQGRNISHPTFW